MKPLLIALAVVLAAAILGGIATPVFSCPDCLGVSRAWGEPHPERPVWIGCPPCMSRGKVTGLRRLRWKPLPVARFVRATDQELFEALEREYSPSGWSGEGRLVQVQGTTYGLVCLKTIAVVRPGTYRVRLLLLDSEGRLLEERDESCSTRQGTLYFSWIDPSQDEAVVQIGQSLGHRRFRIDDGRLRDVPAR